ncbi:DUF3971 domain-containing protein [Bradyrhizobium sp. dw_78]|uniref:YhdP family protein n=1 Tax=Bradyrhizobium sp. dw_78 TaxID=2719793 RepID=UPI001BD2A915|nr:DUF3971 domain-containing protein [Bradyrhizobium sp. dw_78]
MPARERPLHIDGRGLCIDQSDNQRRDREAMARNTSPQGAKGSSSRADIQPLPLDNTGWDHDHEEATGRHARRLLSRSNSGYHRFGDRFGALGRWLGRERWIKRAAITVAVLIAIFATGFGALWWRLGAGPINLDMATPWLASAIEENIGHDNTVEVGGTQIERAGKIRIAVRIRDIIVRDRDHAVVASAPKAEVRLSGTALLMGQLRAESLNLVDATLAVRITPDGYVTVSTGANARPIATGVTSKRQIGAPPSSPAQLPASQPSPAVAAPSPPAPSGATAGADNRGAPSGLLAGLDWLDSLSLTGLDGQNLNEIGLKNGNLIVDDEQRGNKWNFENISLSLRRPSGGGVALSVGEEGNNAWSLRVAVGALANGVRSVDIRADKVPTANILLALRLKDLTYSADLLLSGELKGELGRDGSPTYFSGKIRAGEGHIIDSDTPDYPMAIDSAETDIEWDSARHVLLAPFKIVSGANRITLLAHLEPPNGSDTDWQMGLSGGTIVLAGNGDEQPLIFNRVSVALRFDTEKHRVLLSQADISNGEIGVAGSGSIDYAGEPRLQLGIAGTPMSAAQLKLIWPTLIVPEVREWVLDRVERGSLQRIEIGVNSPVHNLSRRGPPIPDDGLSVNIVAGGVSLRPVDGLPLVHDADLKAHVTGRTATVTIGQAVVDTPAGRKLNISDFAFEVPDLAPKPSPAKVRFRIDGPVPAAAEILASDRLSEFAGTLVDPDSSKGTVSAQVMLGLPIKRAITAADTSYAVTADLTGFSADKLVMNQKLEANALKVVANNQGYQVKGDVKINGQPASLDYRKPNDGDADIKLQATLDDAGRARLGLFDLGPAASGTIPVKVTGKISGAPDHDSRIGVDADLTALKLDNILPGWVKAAGKPAHAVFNVVPKPQSTRFEDIVIDGGGTSMKGSLEFDQNNDLMNANFPTYSPSDGDKVSLKADRGPDGVFRVTMRGDVFDGRGFIKSAISGKEADAKSKAKNVDFDVDVKLGAVIGYDGEALRGVDVKMSRRGGALKSLALSGKLGRDTPVTGELRSRPQGRDMIYLDTNDAGALFRFTDTYAKMIGGQLSLAMDPPSAESSAKEGRILVRDFSIKGEAALDRIAAGGPAGVQNGIAFSGMRAEFTRQNGQLTIREGVVKGPMVGGTIEGSIDYPGNQVRMSGTFVPMYGLNNMFGQIPIVGLFLGGGSNEGLIGVTYELVGSPGQPVLRVNPISAMAPGVFRKIFEFNTGKQSGPVDFPSDENRPPR